MTVLGFGRPSFSRAAYRATQPGPLSHAVTAAPSTQATPPWHTNSNAALAEQSSVFHIVHFRERDRERQRERSAGGREDCTRAAAMADNMAKGVDFEKKAEKKLNGWAFFGSKYEDAADLFDKAGNSYKLAKACEFLNLAGVSLDGFSLC